jgi:hypothetical protein
MTTRGPLRIVALIAVVVVVVLPVAAEESEPTVVRSFAHTMIRGVGAEHTECKADLLLQVRSREMQIVCARFDGSFARFEIRWDLEMLQRDRPSPTSYGTVEPPATALTGWESNSGDYDRIYRIEGKAIGVRFNGGDVLLVW